MENKSVSYLKLTLTSKIYLFIALNINKYDIKYTHFFEKIIKYINDDEFEKASISLDKLIKMAKKHKCSVENLILVNDILHYLKSKKHFANFIEN